MITRFLFCSLSYVQCILSFFLYSLSLSLFLFLFVRLKTSFLFLWVFAFLYDTKWNRKSVCTRNKTNENKETVYEKNRGGGIKAINQAGSNLKRVQLTQKKKKPPTNIAHFLHHTKICHEIKSNFELFLSLFIFLLFLLDCCGCCYCCWHWCWHECVKKNNNLFQYIASINSTDS